MQNIGELRSLFAKKPSKQVWKDLLQLSLSAQEISYCADVMKSNPAWQKVDRWFQKGKHPNQAGLILSNKALFTWKPGQKIKKPDLETLFDRIESLPLLHSVSFHDIELSDFAFLRKCPNLKELSISGCQVDDSDLNFLKDVCSLEKLAIRNMNFFVKDVDDDWRGYNDDTVPQETMRRAFDNLRAKMDNTLAYYKGATYVESGLSHSDVIIPREFNELETLKKLYLYNSYVYKGSYCELKPLNNLETFYGNALTNIPLDLLKDEEFWPKLKRLQLNRGHEDFKNYGVDGWRKHMDVMDLKDWIREEYRNIKVLQV